MLMGIDDAVVYIAPCNSFHPFSSRKNSVYISEELLQDTKQHQVKITALRNLRSESLKQH